MGACARLILRPKWQSGQQRQGMAICAERKLRGMLRGVLRVESLKSSVEGIVVAGVGTSLGPLRREREKVHKLTNAEDVEGFGS